MIAELVELYHAEIQEFELFLLDVNEPITQNGCAGIDAKYDFVVTHFAIKLHTIDFACSKKLVSLQTSGD
jgi:hypothetical protein